MYYCSINSTDRIPKYRMSLFKFSNKYILKIEDLQALRYIMPNVLTCGYMRFILHYFYINVLVGDRSSMY